VSHYNKQLKQVKDFLTLIGDYESLLIMEENAPEYCIAMNVESLMLYLQFKRNEKGTKLLNLASEEVKDVNGNVLTCQGAWKNPKIVDHVTAAVKLLHNARNNSMEYQDPCPHCCERPLEDQYKGCAMHAGLPRLRRRGNPCNSIQYTNCVAQLRKNGKGYQPQGSNFLTPKDLRCLQHHLCFSGCIRDLQTYVMLLLGVKLFLRHDEYSSIKIESFEKVQKRHVIDENGIHGLCLEVMGKSDKVPKQLYIWVDDDNPVFCPVRFLLLYLKVTGIKKGYLFPTYAELTVPPPDGNFETQLSYDSFSKRLTWLFSYFLKRTDKMGCHTGRKTAYLFAIWGGGIPETLMLSARHMTVQASQDYRKDADTLALVLHIHRDPDQLVSPWKPIHCESRVPLEQLNVPSQRFIKPLHLLATEFVVGRLGIPDGTREAGHISSLVKAAMLYKPSISPDQAFDKYLDANVPGPVKQEIMRYHNRLLRQQLNQAAVCQTHLTNQVEPPQEVLPEDEHIPRSLNKSKPKRGGDEDLPARHDVKKQKTTTGKLEIMLKIEQAMESEKTNSNQLTEGARKFVITTLTPVLGCFRHHCKSDFDMFGQKWPVFNPSQFKKSSCKGEECGECGMTS
jgi:hypothetical protein